MTFYNRVILIGSLAESPDTRYTPSGSQVTKLSLQITPGRGSKEGSTPQIIDVISVGEDSRSEGRRFSKGCWVLVEGKIQARSWKTLNGQRRKRLEVIAERIYPLRDDEPIRS